MKTNLYNLKVQCIRTFNYSNVEITWQVVSVHYENDITIPIIDNVLFKGTISDCYAFIQLKNNGLLLET